MNRGEGKAHRLTQIEQLLWAHPEGMTRAEIAKRLNINRSTMTKYLDQNALAPGIYEDEDGKLKLDRAADLTRASFGLHEIMALHLATRLLATRSDKQNPHAASALRKLGKALARLDHNVSAHLLRSADVMDEAAAYRDPVYLKVLETVTEAWSAGRKVKVQHQMPDGRIFEYLLSPYFIEPYAVGQTAHVIGWREPPGARRTLKLERIRAAEITHERYTIPEDFDPGQLLRDAWGIWYTDDAPVAVVLRFHPHVALRVRETRWHPSQQIEDQADGYILWRGQVAEPQEMLPWIRGWGADCEVVEPEGLRELLQAEVRRLTALYQVADVPAPPRHQLLWAKAERKTGRTHPLLCHMLDVAQVTFTLWHDVLTDSLRQHLAGLLGLEQDAAGRLLSFWAALHDLGKACPDFQRRIAAQESKLIAAGLPFPRLFSNEFSPHGIVTTWALEQLLSSEVGMPLRAAKRVATALGGHHGAWPPPDAPARLKPDQTGNGAWDEVRQALVRDLISVWEPPQPNAWIADRYDENTFLTLFSGLTSVADWIGSIETFFPYIEPPFDARRYSERAAIQARRALTELGWTGWQPPLAPPSFEELFPFSPNPMQQQVIAATAGAAGPTFVLIEAPTGSGKTEAALYLADLWAQREQQRGIYVAMPTMATSNQMHGRITDALARRYGAGAAVPLLVHSQAQWMTGAEPPEITSDDERGGAATRAMAWFLPRKRSLLAPFGVGTVDQALLSVLQTRHFFVRLFGLSHKTVIFDEVHAYDTYMSTLFQRLLAWLRATGTSVVLLSATLPAQTRRELVRAYGGTEAEAPEARYPAITWVSGGRADAAVLPEGQNREISLERITPDPACIVAHLKAALREGGCAAVICNTVGRSQEVYRAIREAGLVAPEDLVLFHARTPFAWRDQVERRVLSCFDKDGNRPHKAIVVATQVIEQSLDLDFDLMVSDHAPVDLLLQRAGRLHRHQRAGRPAPVAEPRLLVAVAEEANFPEFGHDLFVYDEVILLRSLLALRGRGRLVLPRDTPGLIETVYNLAAGFADLPPRWEAKLAEAQRKMARADDHDVVEARKRLIPTPAADGLLGRLNAELEEDAPDVHAAFQALTRLAEPSVALVCLHEIAGGLNTEPDGTGRTVTLGGKPNTDLTADLARHTVAVTQRGVFNYFMAQETPISWRQHALLRDHRIAVFNDGLCPLPGTKYTLRLSRELGLEILKD